MLLMLTVHSGIQAQQREEVRSATPIVHAEFKKAKVVQPFGRFIEAQANIFLKDASLCYLDNDTIKKAYLDKIIAVHFDSVVYWKVDDRYMGEVIAQKNYNYLVRVRTIDMEQYTKETDGVENSAFFEFDGIGRMQNSFIDMFGDFHAKSGFPLKEKFYFIVKGRSVVANESHIRKEISAQSMDKFKELMKDRWWSWRDEESLIILLDLLPK